MISIMGTMENWICIVSGRNQSTGGRGEEELRVTKIPEFSANKSPTTDFAETQQSLCITTKNGLFEIFVSNGAFGEGGGGELRAKIVLKAGLCGIFNEVLY